MTRPNPLSALLLTTALTASLFATSALAADIHISSANTTPQAATTNGDTLFIDTNGDLTTTTGAGFTAGAHTNIGTTVNSGNAALGIHGVGQQALDYSNALSSVSGITVTSGIITSNAATSTVNINGLASTYSITTGANGTLSNTGAGGEVVTIGGTNGNQTVTVLNNGHITGTNDAGTIGLRMFDTTGGSSLSVTNNGSITTGNLATAIGVETGSGNVTGNSFSLVNNGSGTITGAISSAVGSTDTGDITNSGSITGNVTNGAGQLGYHGQGNGTVSSITGSTGRVTADLHSNSAVTGDLNLGSNAASTAILSGTSHVSGNAVLGNAGQALTLDGGFVTGTISGTGNVVSDTDNTLRNNINLTSGNVNATSGTLALGATGNNITATNVNIANAALLDFSNTVHTITGNLTGAGGATGARFNLTGQTETVTGTFTTNTHDTIATTLNSNVANNNGHLIVGTNANSAGTNIALTTASNIGYIANGTQYKVIDGTTGTAQALTNDASQINLNGTGGNNTRVLTFNSVANGADLSLQANRVTFASVATTSNGDHVGNALDSIGASSTGNLTTAQHNLEFLTTTAQVNAGLESLTAQADNAATQAVYNSSKQSFDIVSTRLSRLRAAAANETGLSTGNDYAAKNVWMEGFGSDATQGEHSGVAGYDDKSYGFAIGADRAVDKDWRLGFSVNYANNNVDSHDNLKNTDIDTYQANVYASRNLGNGYYTEGTLGFAWSDYNTDRNIAIVPGTSAKGNFEGQTYMARLAAGKRYFTNGFDVTPNAQLTYAHIHTGSYTEKNASALNLSVDGDGVNVLEPRIGIDAGYNIAAMNGWHARPAVRLSYGYDVIGDSQTATSRFAGTSPAFDTTGAGIARGSLDVGAGIDLISADNLSLSANYDYEHRTDYNDSTGMLKLNYAF